MRFLSLIGPLPTLITLLMSAPVSAFGPLNDVPQDISLFPLCLQVAIVLFRKLHHTLTIQRSLAASVDFPFAVSEILKLWWVGRSFSKGNTYLSEQKYRGKLMKEHQSKKCACFSHFTFTRLPREWSSFCI